MTGFVTVEQLLLNIRVNSENAKIGLKSIDELTTELDKNIAKLNKGSLMGLQNRLLGVGLSALFGGMALKMFGTKLLNALVTTFTKIREEGDFFSNQLLGLQAQFEFLKFAIFDTFAQTDLYQNILSFLTSAINAIGVIVSKNPGLAKIIVIASVIAIVLGGILMVIGQVALGVVGLISLFGLVSLPVFALVAAILLVVGAILYATFAWEEFKEVAGLVWESIKNVAGTAMKTIWNLIKIGFNFIKMGALKLGEFIIESVINKIVSHVEEKINLIIDSINATTAGLFGVIENIELPRLDIDITNQLKSLQDKNSKIIDNIISDNVDMVKTTIDIAGRAIDPLLEGGKKVGEGLGLSDIIDTLTGNKQGDTTQPKETVVNNNITVNGVFDEIGMQRTVEDLFTRNRDTYLGSAYTD